MELTYRRCGDYFLPNIDIPAEDMRPLGKYGRMRLRYLREHRPLLFNQLLISSKLMTHLYSIDKACQERMEFLIPQMKVSEGVTYHADTTNIEAFMTLARQYRDANELTASVINSFIDRVIVHAPQKVNGQRSVRIEIIFWFIGSFAVPTAESQPTAEELEEEARRAREREKNHQKYLRRKERKKKPSHKQTAA